MTPFYVEGEGAKDALLESSRAANGKMPPFITKYLPIVPS